MIGMLLLRVVELAADAHMDEFIAYGGVGHFNKQYLLCISSTDRHGQLFGSSLILFEIRKTLDLRFSSPYISTAVNLCTKGQSRGF